MLSSTFRPQQYRFSGSPEAIQAASIAHQSHMQAVAQAEAARQQALGQAAQANAGRDAVLFAQPANFANAFGNAYNSYSSGLGNAYAAYAGGLGNVATALANERSNLYGANAMAEAARMGALGNIGSAGLGAYGSASNAAMDAWARNQMAYNQAASNMHMANQSGLANYGAANAAAQGNAAAAQAGAAGAIGAARANAMGQIGGRQAVANALGGLGLGGGASGGSFTAAGPGGRIADGRFSGLGFGPAPAGGGGSVLRESDVFGGSPLDGLGASGIYDPGVISGLQNNAQAGRSQIDLQHYSSRNMPSAMMGQSLAGLLALTSQSQGAIGAGMDQFYGNQATASDQSMSRLDALRGSLTSGFAGTRNAIGSGFDRVGNQIQGMWDGSLGKNDRFKSPAEREREKSAALAEKKAAVRQQNVDTAKRAIASILARPDRDALGSQRALQRWQQVLASNQNA